MPLVSNHLANAFKGYDSFIDFIASPNDDAAMGNTALGFSGNNFRLHNTGRRYQRPTVLLSFTLALSTGVIGGLVGEYTFVPYWHACFQTDKHDVTSAKRAGYLIDCTCALTMVFHLYISTLRGHLHELNPKRYYKSNKFTTPGASGLFRKLQSHLITTFLVPAISCLFVCGYNGDLKRHELLMSLSVILKELGVLLVFCAVAAASVGFYTAGVDEGARRVLCTPGSKLQRFVREVTCGRAPNSQGGRESSITFEQEEGYVVDVMLHSILHGDVNLVAQISKSTFSANPNYAQLERYEAERNANAMAAMAKILISPRRQRSEAPLEEDVLRHSILESLGGVKKVAIQPLQGMGTNNAALIVHEDYPAEERHQEAVRYWIQPPSNAVHLDSGNVRTTGSEPKGVVCLRALCAYTGGLGQALTECSKSQSPYIDWHVPPACVVATEYAMIAIARCIEHNLKDTKELADDWRSTHLPMLIPAALNSLYLLHQGVIDFSQYRIKVKMSWTPGFSMKHLQANTDHGSRDMGILIDQLSNETPELLGIVHACDGAVRIIIRQLRSSEGSLHGMRTVMDTLDRGCSTWVQQNMSLH